MTVEQQLCKRLADILKELLPGVDVEGNFLPDETDTFKGMDVYQGASIDVVVSTRAYDTFSTHTAELRVDINGELPVESDPDLSATIGLYADIVHLLEDWRGDIASVKRDLTLKDGEDCTIFDPVGLRLDNGDFELDPESKSRTFQLPFTVRGRITKGN